MINFDHSTNNITASSGNISINGIVPSGGGTFRMNAAGNLTTTTGTVRFYPHATMTISGFYITIGSPLTTVGSFTIRKNGSSVATGSLPVNTYFVSTTALSLTLTASDYLTVDYAAYTGRDMAINFIYSL